MPVLATPGRHSDRPPCLLLACACARVQKCVCVYSVPVFPFKITPSSPVMSQCTHSRTKCPHAWPPLHHSRDAWMVDVREHWQVWAQLCSSRSGACSSPGVREWPGAAAAVTPGISFPDRPARGNVEVAGSRRPAGETCGGRSCGDWGRVSSLCCRRMQVLWGALWGASSLRAWVYSGGRSTPSRPPTLVASPALFPTPTWYMSDPSRRRCD